MRATNYKNQRLAFYIFVFIPTIFYICIKNIDIAICKKQNKILKILTPVLKNKYIKWDKLLISNQKSTLATTYLFELVVHL